MTLVAWFDFDGERVVTQFTSANDAEIFVEYLGVQGLWHVSPARDASWDTNGRYGQETATRDARALQSDLNASIA